MLLDYRAACAKSHGKSYMLMGDYRMRLAPWSLMLGGFLAIEALHFLLGFGVPTVSEAPDGVMIGCGEQDHRPSKTWTPAKKEGSAGASWTGVWTSAHWDSTNIWV